MFDDDPYDYEAYQAELRSRNLYKRSQSEIEKIRGELAEEERRRDYFEDEYRRQISQSDISYRGVEGVQDEVEEDDEDDPLSEYLAKMRSIEEPEIAPTYRTVKVKYVYPDGELAHWGYEFRSIGEKNAMAMEEGVGRKVIMDKTPMENDNARD